MELHIWSSAVSGSMSSFKVKGQMYMQEKSPILILGLDQKIKRLHILHAHVFHGAAEVEWQDVKVNTKGQRSYL